MRLSPVLAIAVAIGGPACGETGRAAWLRYAPAPHVTDLPAAIVAMGNRRW